MKAFRTKTMPSDGLPEMHDGMLVVVVQPQSAMAKSDVTCIQIYDLRFTFQTRDAIRPNTFDVTN